MVDEGFGTEIRWKILTLNSINVQQLASQQQQSQTISSAPIQTPQQQFINPQFHHYNPAAAYQNLPSQGRVNSPFQSNHNSGRPSQSPPGQAMALPRSSMGLAATRSPQNHPHSITRPPNQLTAQQTNHSPHMSRPQISNVQPQQPMQHSRPPPIHNPKNDYAAFMRSLMEFMSKRGTPITNMPSIGNKAVNLPQLFIAVSRSGGSKSVTAQNLWPTFAQKMGFTESDGEILSTYFSTYLGPFEEHMMQRQHAVKMQSIPQNRLQQSTSTSQGALSPNIQTAGSPRDSQPPKPTTASDHAHPKSMKVEPVSPPPPSSGVSGSRSPSQSIPVELESVKKLENEPDEPAPPKEYKPRKHVPQTYGGLDIETMARLSSELERVRDHPYGIMELASINVQALTMSLQSGLLGEVSVAIDSLSVIMGDPRCSIPLSECRDLLDALLDVIESEMEILASFVLATTESGIPYDYEDFLDMAAQEILDLSPPAQTLKETRRRVALDRLEALTTIMRNLSFFAFNMEILATSSRTLRIFVKLVDYLRSSSLEFYIGKSQIALEISKDSLVFLANISHAMKMNDKESLAAYLDLILIFAPCSPRPITLEDLHYPEYFPEFNPYLPPAIEVLARLLARDVPNRQILALILSSNPLQHTRLFSMAVSPLLESPSMPIRAIWEEQLPLVGLAALALDVLVQLLPPESGLAELWLNTDSLIRRLLQLVQGNSLSRASFIPGGVDDGQRSALNRISKVIHGLVSKTVVSRGTDEPLQLRGGLSTQMYLAVLTGPAEDTVLLEALGMVVGETLVPRRAEEDCEEEADMDAV
ncbi:SWI/SNF chromatin-remodeling complex subunit sol1 [Neolecta irregularis DAH-3]|uniref:SWI/SNF chromatin-remodeling complex subunit sol1 n=1 Tax=Neolecta irregularis (strain DAH-3) TaxID=1198029 RepID=A0A1U7LGT4_NEOID|nr:SWI/SNF chromatin-remodeling complex subunit sol1 [Neolecta irregularis DAH-3]|eukprot:OLL21864.1 SWI/SNF chromatin-remodeling complex subunit sol1 [Neolecta irregularis DAH-3]